MKRKTLKLGILIIVFVSIAMVHQYFWGMPEQGIFPRQEISIAEIQSRGLRPEPYPPTVWFEIIPDAFTTLFKRFALGGWTELGHIACGTGCIENEIRWTDGFQTIDIGLEDFSVDGESIMLPEFRWIRLEVWGGVRHAFARQNEGKLPVVGQKLKACGYLRRDNPYDWLEIHPRSAKEMEIVGTCRTQ